MWCRDYGCRPLVRLPGMALLEAPGGKGANEAQKAVELLCDRAIMVQDVLPWNGMPEDLRL